jgi:hypothetical protein
MVFSLHSSLSSALAKVSLWGWALFLSVGLALLGVVLIVSVSNFRRVPVIHEDMPYEPTEDEILSMQGLNIGDDLRWANRQIFGDDEDAAHIASGVMQSLFEGMFGMSVDLQSSLTTVGLSPYAISVHSASGGVLEWVFAVEEGREVDSRQEILHLLKEGFSTRFLSGIVRTRVLPSGNVVRDIVADTQGIEVVEERVNGFSVHTLRHRLSGREFVYALHAGYLLRSGKDRLVLSNSRERLIAALERSWQPGYRLFLSRKGLDLFTALFPESDMTNAIGRLIPHEGTLCESCLFCSSSVVLPAAIP